MLENTEGAIENGQSRETDNIGYTKTKKKNHNTICVGHHYMQTNTNNVNKTWAFPAKTDRTSTRHDLYFGKCFCLLCTLIIQIPNMR